MLEVIALATVCFINLSLAAIVLLNNPNALLNRVYGSLLVVISVWSVIVFLEDHPGAVGAIELLARLDYALGVAMLGLFYWFCVVLSKWHWSVVDWGVGVFCAVAVVLSALGFTASARLEDDVMLQPGVGFPVFIVLLGLALISGIVSLLRKYKISIGQEKTQISLVGLGLILTAIGLVLAVVVAPRVFGVADAAVTRAGIYSILIFSSFSTYAVVRHRFLDIRTAVARALAYILTLSSLAFIYAAAIFGLSSLVLEDIGDINRLNVVVYTVLALVLAFSFQAVKHFFDHLSDSIFFRDTYNTRQLLNTLNRILAGEVDLQKLLNKTIKTITDNLKSDYCVFVIRKTEYFPRRIIGSDGSNQEHFKGMLSNLHLTPHKLVATDYLEDKTLQKRLNSRNISMVVPLISGKDRVGQIIIGPKRSGDLYSKKDIQIMEIISNELVIAIQNALRFEEIQKFNETLQEKVDNATRQLRQKNERLRVLDKTKDDFISMASHQLRTPLTSVKGYLSMVLDGDAGRLNKLQRKLLNQSYVSSQRMVYLISDLLNVSRLRTGKFELDEVATDLAKVVAEEVGQLKETAQARKLKLTYTKPDNFPTYMLDETKLRQVIMNFVDNAIYYTPSGGSIEITLADNEKSIDLAVKDTGIGVPKRDIPHMFSKYFRAGNAKVARPDGTGLGLFMAKKVVVAHGGAIIFKTRENHGSTFGFSLPKSALKAPPSKKPPDTKT